MFENFNKEFDNFLKDIDKTIKDKKVVALIEEKAQILMKSFLQDYKKIVEKNDKVINRLIENQEKSDKILNELKEKVNNIYLDIYDEEENDFSINCPYCNYEFDACIDEELNEIKCPECGNSIELDWNGNISDDDGCSGNCHHCGGCK